MTPPASPRTVGHGRPRVGQVVMVPYGAVGRVEWRQWVYAEPGGAMVYGVHGYPWESVRLAPWGVAARWRKNRPTPCRF